MYYAEFDDGMWDVYTDVDFIPAVTPADVVESLLAIGAQKVARFVDGKLVVLA